MKAIRLPIGAPMLCMAAASLLAFPLRLHAKIDIRPERQSVDCFVGIEELNRIIITGVHPTELELSVTHGYGHFRIIAQEWYWAFTPSSEDIIDSKFVRFQAVLRTERKAEKPIKSDFIISVNKLLWASEWPYWPLGADDRPVAYAGIPVSASFKCKGLDGHYDLVVEKDGKYWRESPEPHIDFAPGRDDLGKILTFKLFYASSPKAIPMMIHRYSVTVANAAFSISHDSRASANDLIRLSAWIGIDGTYNAPESPYLLVKSDEFFRDTAYLIREYKGGISDEFEDADLFYDQVRRHSEDTALIPTCAYLVRVTNKASTIAKPTKIKFSVIYPATGQSCASNIVLGRDR